MRVTILKKNKKPNKPWVGLIDLNGFFAFTEVCYSSLHFHCLKQSYHPYKHLFAFDIPQSIILRYQLGIRPLNS